jgi:predicted transcriptional regulator
MVFRLLAAILQCGRLYRGVAARHVPVRWNDRIHRRTVGLRDASCYVCAAMSDTTTIRLPPKLRSRLRAIAKDTDRSVHSIIVEAVEKHVAHEEQMRSLVKEALAADDQIERTGEVYRSEDVHAWAQRLGGNEPAPRPKPWRK